MNREYKTDKKANRKRNTTGLLLVCLLLVVVGVGILFNLNKTRKGLIEECENALLWEVQLTSKEISEDIENKFAAMETIQEMIVQTCGVGPEAVKTLAAAKLRYGMDYLAVIDTEYTYYDNEGDIFPDVRTANVEAAMGGKNVVDRSVDEVSGDGAVFLVPCWSGEEVVGVLVAKVSREDLLGRLSVKQQEGTDLVLNTAGEVLLTENDLGNYLGGLSWDEFMQKGESWKAKKRFDEEIQLKGCAVASATNEDGKDIYFAASKVEGYEGFFVVRLTNSEVVEKEIRQSMDRILALMVFMGILIGCVVISALVVYVRNRVEIYNTAYVDQLTGLPSKAKHKLDAQELLDKAEKQYAYVTFDVDNFKFINEMFGYEYGNRVLNHIAKNVKESVRSEELCARISSDNFAMLLLDTGTREELEGRISELFQRITEPGKPGEVLNICSLNFSCGVYRIDGKQDINAVRANANLARSENKKSLRDEIIFYDEKLKARRVEEKELEYEAEEALLNGEFLVYLQPKYDVESEKIIGAEALVRWLHPVKGMLSPMMFVPLFESNGFITEIDLYVLDRVCALIERWLTEGVSPICISVNLSRIHLYERDLVKRLCEVVSRHKVPPEYIEFELTESAFYEETDNLLRIMAEIKAAGFRLSMDDFGSGYSSLNLLRRLPVDVLKLDKVFLEDCDEEAEESRGKRIVTHVISMAKDLKMEVLAEGVETSNQKEFLQKARCDMIQGYYYAKPMPAKEFELLFLGEKDSQDTAHQPAVE